LELISKFVYKLVPYVGDVISDGVEPVNPDSHITYPSFNVWSFDKGESDSDFSDGGVESCDILINLEVGFDLFDESIYFSPCSIKYPW
jgi:hypothetical protein